MLVLHLIFFTGLSAGYEPISCMVLGCFLAVFQGLPLCAGKQVRGGLGINCLVFHPIDL